MSVLAWAMMSSMQINCAVRYEDCAIEIATVENGIGKAPKLAKLRERIDTQLLTITAEMTKEAGLALAQDEQRYRRSLRRDLFRRTDRSTLDVDEIALLEERLKRRLDWLNAIRSKPRKLAGHWRNASGEITITMIAPGRYWVWANLVELDFLKWTCELSGEGIDRNGKLTVDIGKGERLELKREGDLLRSKHVLAGFSGYCGANGHANGAWFSSKVAEDVYPAELL